jgi:hypothetical protein
MKHLRVIAAVVLLLLLGVAAWLWLSVPAQVDLADYAPADAVVYVEFNNLADVARAIQNTEAWQAAALITHSKPAGQNRLFHAAARAGIAPIDAVLFARTQVALVVVGLDAAEYDQTLHVRPEIALIAETHTSRWRTRPAAIDAVKHLAKFAYGVSACTERSGDADYIECSGGDRKIVGAVDGSLVVLGNSDNAVKSCLDVRRGMRPSIHNDFEFLRARYSVAEMHALGFGYISSKNSAKLFSWAAPLLMNRAPGDQQLEQLLAVSAGKILRGIAWTAVPSGGGIEDRFVFSLEPGVVSRLGPAFQTSGRDDNIWKLVPSSFESLTIYRAKEPAAAWSSLDSAVASKLDALPAVLFGTLLKSSLSPYGISNPKEALTTLNPPLLTMKPSAAAQGSVLIARVNDEARLRRSLSEEVFTAGKGQILEGLQSEPDPAKEFAAVFADGYVLLGNTENMKQCLAELRKSEAVAASGKEKVQNSARESSAAIVTYANDEARLNGFISTLLMLQGRQLSNDELAALQNTLQRSSFSATETRLSDAGIERKTHSAFGQFSTLISLLQTDRSSLPR